MKINPYELHPNTPPITNVVRKDDILEILKNHKNMCHGENSQGLISGDAMDVAISYIMSIEIEINKLGR